MTQVRFPDLTSRSAELNARARRTLPGGTTRHSVVYPPYMVYSDHGQGYEIVDVDGVTRIDFINNFSSMVHGHCHPVIRDAVLRQVGRMTASTMPNEEILQLAELLVERLPGVDKVNFGNSGTEAVLFAVKVARAFTGRPKIAKIEGGFHGQYDLVQHSLTSSPANWGPEEAPNTVALDKGTPQEVLDLCVTMSPNNVEASRAVIQRHARDLAAIIVDPIPARLVCKPLTKDYLQMLREEATRHGIVLVYDAVISLRAGYHGPQGELGVVPDLTVMGKIIGGGFPIGALGGREEIMSLFDPTRPGGAALYHGGTFSGNVVSMAAGYAAMSLLTPEAFEKLAAHGERLRQGINQAAIAAGYPARAYGYGSMTGVVPTDKPFLTYRDTIRAVEGDFMGRMQAFHNHMLAEGVLISPVCMLYNSTVMTDQVIDQTIEAAHRSFRKMVQETA